MFFEFESPLSNYRSMENNGNFQNKKNSGNSMFCSSPSLVSSTPNTFKAHLGIFSPLASTSDSSKISNALGISSRHRRYSLHSGQFSLPLDTLKENHSFCDLSLITKKKLMQLNSGPLKLEGRFIEPDIKLNQSFTKNSNSDLRKEVLLASMQRSLSASTEDLSFSNRTISSNNMIGNSDTNFQSGDCLMEMAINNSFSKFLIKNNIEHQVLMDEQMIDLHESPKKVFPVLKKAIRSTHSYMPSENQINLNSSTTSTSTTSMAGSKNVNQLNNCRSLIKKLNVDPMSANSNSNAFIPNGNYHYSNSNIPKLTLTMSSSSMLNTSLKKRLHSSSFSKFSSPYHTIASNTFCKDPANLIFTNTPTTNLSTLDWEIAFKRLKVMHNNNEFNLDCEANNTDETDVSSDNQSTSQTFTKPTNNNSHQHQNELNELAQDFHRLKTPFI